MRNTARFQYARRTLTSALWGLLLTVGGLTSLPPSADAATDFTRPGPYLGLGVAGGLEDFGGGRSAFGDSAGLTVRGGYRIAPYFAVEGVYEYMDDFGLAATTLGGAKFNADLRTHNFSLMGKAILPFGFVQPYLSGGVGFLNTDSTGKLRGQEVHGGVSTTEFAGRVGQVWT